MPFIIKRALFGVALIVGFSNAANAATLSVSADKLTYLVGETITLTVTGDDAGASAYGVFGRLEFSGALVDNSTRSQVTLVGQGGSWVTGLLLGKDNGVSASSEVFNQIAGTTPFSADTATNLPAAFATTTLIAQAVGVVNVNWNTNVVSGFQLNFFGLTNAPGTSFTIIPEPATAALLGLGLLGLVGWRRARE